MSEQTTILLSDEKMRISLTDKEKIALLRLADQAVKDLEREAHNLPRPVVYYCKGIEQIKILKKHFESCIEDWTKRLPGSEPFVRKIFTALIERAEYELKEINSSLEILNEMALRVTKRM